MRRFNSYGPVDCEESFCVERLELVNRTKEQLIGNPEKGGHYFTVWAPRQTGKTWLMRQVKAAVDASHPDQFTTGMMSMQEMHNPPGGVDEFKNLFLREKGVFQKPLILFIDEFDSLSAPVSDLLVALFRDMYLKRESYLLHGLALIGVRAVLGVESERGSPFNIQRSLHVPNFEREEVEDLFRQYRSESTQKVEPAVVQSVYEATLGQPGLVCWFGELLTETYNPGLETPIGLDDWNDVFRLACVKEWNNTILNLVKKARGQHRDQILQLFSRSDIPFTIDSEWRSFAYLNGIIDSETVEDAEGRKTEICRFANPFIQHRLYNAFMLDLVGDRSPILALEPFDKMTDVFDKPELDISALLERYKGYLVRLKSAGLNPWKDQPRRTDLHLREAIGHFHLYFWLKQAIEDICIVSPEFPTGNGRVDLHLQCGDKAGVIEVKSYKSQANLEKAQIQAAGYANSLKMPSIAIAVFVPVEDDSLLKRLSGKTVIDGVKVMVSAIGWV